MTEGAELTWTWEMYGVSSKVWVEEVRPGRLIPLPLGRLRPRAPPDLAG